MPRAPPNVSSPRHIDRVGPTVSLALALDDIANQNLKSEGEPRCNEHVSTRRAATLAAGQ